MSRETEWAVFEKAVDITASAVRGTMGGEATQPPSYVGDLFREVYGALKETADSLQKEPTRPGF
jgi:hypothetical protein